MKKISFLSLLVSLSVISLSAQMTQKRNVSSFSSINVCCGIEVVLAQGSSESVTVEANPDDISYVKTDVKGKTLNIGFDNNRKNRRGKVKVRVTAGNLDKLEANSSGKIEGTNTITAGDIKLNVNSSGKINLDLEAKNVKCDGNSAGSMKISGKADYVKVSNNSASSINLQGLKAVRAEASSNSGASIDITVSDQIKAHANSGATVRYYGNPTRKDVSSNSGGRVQHKQ